LSERHPEANSVSQMSFLNSLLHYFVHAKSQNSSRTKEILLADYSKPGQTDIPQFLRNEVKKEEPGQPGQRRTWVKRGVPPTVRAIEWNST
jgi:NurA-like 5'-3' nuclease